MHSTLIVARMAASSREEVARIFSEFDRTDMPVEMGTRRRQLFAYRDLYFHMQDFDSDGAEAIRRARSRPAFIDISNTLKAHIDPYDPATWTSPADAMAHCFYHWERSS